MIKKCVNCGNKDSFHEGEIVSRTENHGALPIYFDGYFAEKKIIGVECKVCNYLMFYTREK